MENMEVDRRFKHMKVVVSTEEKSDVGTNEQKACATQKTTPNLHISYCQDIFPNKAFTDFEGGRLK